MRSPHRFLAIVVAALVIGCAPWAGPQAPGVVPYLPNPLPVGAVDRELLWFTLVDITDDYFRIRKEQRVRLVENVLVEGRIDTHPQVGATLLEPWRRDSVTPYERLESTLQSIRRIAVIRVIPSGNGFLIDVQVFKELQDVPVPLGSTAGQATFRNDSSLERYGAPNFEAPAAEGWIAIGRDVALEQTILGQLQRRIPSATTPVVVPNQGNVGTPPIPTVVPNGALVPTPLGN